MSQMFNIVVNEPDPLSSLTAVYSERRGSSQDSHHKHDYKKYYASLKIKYYILLSANSEDLDDKYRKEFWEISFLQKVLGWGVQSFWSNQSYRLKEVSWGDIWRNPLPRKTPTHTPTHTLHVLWVRLEPPGQTQCWLCLLAGVRKSLCPSRRVCGIFCDDIQQRWRLFIMKRDDIQ